MILSLKFVLSDLIFVPEHYNLIRNMSELMSNLNSAWIQTLLHFRETGLICCATCPGASTLRVDLLSSHSHDLLGLHADGDLIWHKHPAVFTFHSYPIPHHEVPECGLASLCKQGTHFPFVNNQMIGMEFFPWKSPSMVQFHY